VKKADLKFVVDALLFLSTVGTVLVGLLLGFVIPRGPVGSGEAKYLLGLHRHAWGDIHLYLGIAFAALAALHLVLGWSWVKGKARQLFHWRWTAAVVSMPVLALLVVFVLWAVSPSDVQKYADHAKATGRTRAARGLAGGVDTISVSGPAAASGWHRGGLPAAALARRPLHAGGSGRRGLVDPRGRQFARSGRARGRHASARTSRVKAPGLGRPSTVMGMNAPSRRQPRRATSGATRGTRRTPGSRGRGLWPLS